MVSILGMVYDCHFGPLLRSWGGVLMVPVGRMGLCWPGIALSVVWGAGGRGGGLVVCVQSRELGPGTPRLPRFILLVSFSDTLLVVSISDIVMIGI